MQGWEGLMPGYRDLPKQGQFGEVPTLLSAPDTWASTGLGRVWKEYSPHQGAREKAPCFALQLPPPASRHDWLDELFLLLRGHQLGSSSTEYQGS